MYLSLYINSFYKRRQRYIDSIKELCKNTHFYKYRLISINTDSYLQTHSLFQFKIIELKI